MASIDQITNYFKIAFFLENEENCTSLITKAISTLSSYKVITKVDYRLIPSFKKLF